MSIGVAIDVPNTSRTRLARVFERYQGPYDDLMESVAALLESQTRRRIQEIKAAPDGEPWPEWDEAYVFHPHGNDRAHWEFVPHTTDGSRPVGGHSYLQLDGGLLDSITSEASVDEAIVGSNLVYAAKHQFGGDGVKPRPYLGLSDEDEREIVELVEDWFNDQ